MDELADLKKSVDELGAAMNKMLATVDSARKVIKELEAENAELRQTIKQARELFELGRQPRGKFCEVAQ